MDQRIRAGILAAAGCATAGQLTQAVCDALAKSTAVLVRIWRCQGEETLQLVGSAGSPLGGGSYHRVDGEFRQVQRGLGKIGKVAATREPFIARQFRGDEDWLANPGWAARQNVRAFVAYPLIAADEILGVLALFDRVVPTDEALDGLQFIADVTAVRLRAFSASAFEADVVPAATPVMLTRRELREAEKRSIEAALAQANGKVFGANGAAALLGMKPTTLASRIKTLGLK